MGKINLDNVPIKYILGTFRDDKEYPTGEDILYLMTKRASDKNKVTSPVTFTTTVLFKVLGEDLIDAANISLSLLEKEGHITKNKETKTGISYTINKNNYI